MIFAIGYKDEKWYGVSDLTNGAVEIYTLEDVIDSQNKGISILGVVRDGEIFDSFSFPTCCTADHVYGIKVFEYHDVTFISWYAESGDYLKVYLILFSNKTGKVFDGYTFTLGELEQYGFHIKNEVEFYIYGTDIVGSLIAHKYEFYAITSESFRVRENYIVCSDIVNIH